jgi:hypothetical protein
MAATSSKDRFFYMPESRACATVARRPPVCTSAPLVHTGGYGGIPLKAHGSKPVTGLEPDHLLKPAQAAATRLQLS